MTPDHYATLGVAPRSEAAAIRAAYLGLMRRFHPDKNDDPTAIERAQAVIAAFAVLGDQEKRLHYDWDRRRAAEAAAAPQRSWLGKVPRALVAAAVVLLLMMPFAVMRSPSAVREPPVAPATAVAAVADIADDVTEVPTAREVVTPLTDMVPNSAPNLDTEIEAISMTPRVAEPAPRVEKAPLAILPAPRSPPPRSTQLARKEMASVKPPASARCRLVNPGAETAICEDDNLAALDRTAVTFYNQSLSFGNAAKRAALVGSRDSFLIRREACRSDPCLRNVHLSHMREISAIVENRPPVPPR